MNIGGIATIVVDCFVLACNDLGKHGDFMSALKDLIQAPELIRLICIESLVRLILDFAQIVQVPGGVVTTLRNGSKAQPGPAASGRPWLTTSARICFVRATPHR